MSSIETDLKLKVGSGDWRPLHVRQFEVTETQPEADIPEWLRMSCMPEATASMAKPDIDLDADDELNEEAVEEIDQLHQEGGKHAYAAADDCAEDEDEILEQAEIDDNIENLPNWIVCLTGTKSFSLTQALEIPHAMQLRN